MAQADLIIVGAGAKAAAIAAKVHVLNSLGLGPFTLTIIEGNQPAASWLGLNGATSGEEPLAIPAIKDVGFPYQSHDVFGGHGADVDHAMLSFSWQQYLINNRTLRPLGQRGVASGAASRLRPLPRVGSLPRERRRDDGRRPCDARLAAGRRSGRGPSMSPTPRPSRAIEATRSS